MTLPATTYVDLRFALRGRSVPRDYAYSLWDALRQRIPCLTSETLAGIHPLYGLSPGDDEWYLSRRAHLDLRISADRVAEMSALVGEVLDVSGASCTVGNATEKLLAYAPVLYAKFVAFEESEDDLPAEEVFLSECRGALASLDLAPTAVLCGKRQAVRAATSRLHGFSLMVAGLGTDDAYRLQKHGLGIGRKLGCGIFIPHKSAM